MYDFGLMVKDWDDPAYLRRRSIRQQTRAAEERRMRELGYETYYDTLHATTAYRRLLTPREQIERRLAAIERRIDRLLGNLPEPAGEWQGINGNEAYVESGFTMSLIKADADAMVTETTRKIMGLRTQLEEVANGDV